MTADALMQNLTIDSGSGTAVDASERVSADMVFTRWPKIGQMQDAVKAASWMFATKEEAQLSGKAERAVWADAEGKNAVKMPTTLQFKAKVKVDGTNGGVILSRKFSTQAKRRSKSIRCCSVSVSRTLD